MEQVQKSRSAKELIQAHRAEVEFYLQRTAFSDLLPNEIEEASGVFLGIGMALMALKNELDQRDRVSSPTNEAPAKGLLGLLGASSPQPTESNGDASA